MEGDGIVVIITLWQELASMHELYGKRTCLVDERRQIITITFNNKKVQSPYQGDFG